MAKPHGDRLDPISRLKKKICQHPGSTRKVAEIFGVRGHTSIAEWRSRFNVPEGGLSMKEWIALYPDDVLAKEAIAS